MDTVSLVVANELIEKLLHLDHTLSLFFCLPLSLSLSLSHNEFNNRFSLVTYSADTLMKKMISLYVIAALVWCIWYVKLILIWRGPTCQAGIVEKKDKRYIYVNCWHRPEWCELQCIWKQSLHFIPIYVECIYNIECFCKWNAYDNQDTSDNAFSSSITNQLLHVYIFITSSQYCFIDHQVTATCANPE